MSKNVGVHYLNMVEIYCTSQKLWLSLAYLSFFWVQNTATNDEYLSVARYKLLTILTTSYD